VPCHRDFGPRNWLWDATTAGVARSAGAGLGVIDFEHARPDVWWVDVQRLIDDAWRADPGLEDAFWLGYGRRPGADERRLGAALRLLYAVGTVAWGAEHGDAPFEAQGRAVLRRLGAPGCGP
jgi:Ser/Thr protein kinase RdoA (MazF antagonist)